MDKTLLQKIKEANGEVYTKVVLSTAHTKYSDSRTCDKFQYSDKAFMPDVLDSVDEHGYTFKTSFERDDREGFSDELYALLEQFAESGVDYVQFDADAREFDFLPQYEW